jgi:hypothetical protein
VKVYPRRDPVNARWSAEVAEDSPSYH